MFCFRALFCGALFGVIGCGTGDNGTAKPTGNDPDAGSGGTSSNDGSTSGGSGGVGGTVAIDASGDASNEPAIVFAHTFLELFQLDPLTLDLVSLGEFVRADGSAFVPPSGLEDIAINQDGVMYGIAQEADPTPHGQLYRIDYSQNPPVCTAISTTLNVYANGLTFVPKGMLDPDKEVLMASGGQWWRVDVDPSSNAATAQVLAGLPAAWASKGGDSVGIIGDAVFTTAQPTNGPEESHLLTFDPKTGLVEDVGATGVVAFWGLAYWGGVLYGFDNYGKFHSIDRTTGHATEIALPMDLDWYGAGVTTSAPIELPK
jgi:hypothetical protein